MADRKEPEGAEAQFKQIVQDANKLFKDSVKEELDDFLKPPMKEIEELLTQIDKQNSQFSTFREKRRSIFHDLNATLPPIYSISGMVTNANPRQRFSAVEAIYGAVARLISAARDISDAYVSIIELFGQLTSFTSQLNDYIHLETIDTLRNMAFTILATLFEIFVVAAKEFRCGRFRSYFRTLFGDGARLPEPFEKLEDLRNTLLTEYTLQIQSKAQEDSSYWQLDDKLLDQLRSVYVYKPLCHAEQEIRLLTLAPPTSDDTTLQCTLQHVPLPKAPPYIALSYHWGSPGITTSIEVNGVTLQVTMNLEAALRRLRAAGLYTIWADALCIDQTDSNEKSLQVPRIGTIFRKASEVAIWLGGDIDLDETSREYMRSGTAPKPDRGTCLSTLPVFKHLLGRPYWRRVWIIQELAVASRITLYCGSFRIPWRAIDANCDCCQDGSFVTAGGRPADENVCRFTMLRQVRADFLSRKPIRLLDAMHRTRSSLATDPRDKIFALLGLAYDGQHFVPEPSYLSSVADSFTEFATSLLENGDPLDFIYLRSGKRRVEGDLPSWVPARTDPNDAVAHRQSDNTTSNPATSAKSPSTYEVPDISISGSELIAKGVLIDTVNGLGSALTFEDGASSHEPTSPNETPNPYQTEEETSRVVCQTLVPYFKDDQEDEIPPDFHRLWSVESDQQLEELMPASAPRSLSSPLRAWLAENRSLMVHGQTMESWTKARSNPASGSNPDRTGHRLFTMVRCCMRFLITTRGYLGWAHPQAMRGDRIAVIFGCSRPVIMRTYREGYRVVGDASVLYPCGEYYQLVNPERVEDLRIL